MSRQLYFSLNPYDWAAFVYNSANNLHRGVDEAHSIATLQFLLRSNQVEEAKKWYKQWRLHIPACELSHDQLMMLDEEYRLKHQAKQQLMAMIDSDQIGTLLVSVLGKLVASVEPEPQPEPERNHHPRAKATTMS